MNSYGFLESHTRQTWAGLQRSPNTSHPPFPHQAQLPRRPSVQGGTAASSAASVLWELLFHLQDSSSENTAIRIMMNTEKNTLSPLSTSQHPCLSSLPYAQAPNLILCPLPPCPPPLPGHMAGDRGKDLSLPSSQVPFSPPAQTLGPIQRSSHTTQGSWGQVSERGEPVLFRGQPGPWLTDAQRWVRAPHPTIRGSCLLFTMPEPLPAAPCSPNSLLVMMQLPPCSPFQGGYLTLPPTHRVLQTLLAHFL